MRILLPLLLLPALAFGQIRADRISIGTDYNHLNTGVTSSGEDRELSLWAEVRLTKLLSAEAYYRFDNHYQNFLPLSAVLRNRNQYFFGGLRFYPFDNFHSQALALRNKRADGFYLSLGYTFWNNSKDMVAITQLSEPLMIDGQPVVNADGSLQQVVSIDRLDNMGVNLLQWGQNFGFGWKQYHNKWVATDIGLYSDAFFRENRKVTDYYNKGFRKDGAIDEAIYEEDQWDNYLNFVEYWGKNGRGLEVRMLLIFNLDFRR